MVRERIQQKYGVCVNFSDNHSNYYSAYQYVIKDGDFTLSDEHPSYVNSPQTNKASKKRLSSSSREVAQKRSKGLIALCDLIVAKTLSMMSNIN